MKHDERDFQDAVIELGERYGWRVYHPPDNVPRVTANGRQFVQNIRAGWPDAVFVRPPELLVAEFKSDRGRLSVAQRDWLDALAACGIETFVWRPRDFDAAHRRLRGRT